MGELKDVLWGDKKVQGRDENIDEMYQQVSQPITTNITVMFSVLEKYEAVKYVVVQDMLGTPLSLTRDSVKQDSALYDDDKLEEVSGEQGMMLKGLSSYQDAAELRGGRVEEHQQGVQREGRVEEGQVGEKM